jgi:hypothetical protein
MKLRLGFCAAILVVAGIFGIHQLQASAQQEVPAPCVVTVPADWGQFKGISKFGLVFEDKAGTLRVIDQMPCDFPGGQGGVPRVSVEVRRK